MNAEKPNGGRFLDGPAAAARCSSISSSGTNEAEDLVAAALHLLVGVGLEVEAQQRLGVRRAHVEVPVGEVDRQAVEVAELAALAVRAVALLELLQLERDVVD